MNIYAIGMVATFAIGIIMTGMSYYEETTEAKRAGSAILALINYATSAVCAGIVFA